MVLIEYSTFRSQTDSSHVLFFSEYPSGASVLCQGRFCSDECATVGCPVFIEAHTCALLRFCYPADSGSDVWLLPDETSLAACDFTNAEQICDGSQGSTDDCCNYVIEDDHSLQTYYFASRNACEGGQKAAVRVQDFDETATQCEAFGTGSSRIKNCDCDFGDRPSTLVEPCHTQFTQGCLADSPADKTCCETGDCIALSKDVNSAAGLAAEEERQKECNDAIPGYCALADQDDCCTRTCSECGLGLGPETKWNVCFGGDFESSTANCGFKNFLPFQCDFSLCESGDQWDTNGAAYKQWLPPPAVSPICFSGENYVMVQDVGAVKMSDIKIGDFVQVKNDTYERVYSFGHLDKTTVAEYLQIFVENAKNPLELSSDHMIFISVDTSVPASLVKVDDTIVMADGKNAVVKKIRTVRRRGLYAPFTASGHVVVSDVLASNYVALEANSSVLTFAGFSTGVSLQAFAHIFNAPHRMICSINFELCKNESYNDAGISTWVSRPLATFTWLLDQSNFVQALFGLPFVSIFLVLAFVETAFARPIETLLAIFCLVMMLDSNKILRGWKIGLTFGK